MKGQIQMALASNSKIFLEGIRKIVEDKGDVKIIAEPSNHKEIEKCFTKKNPKFLLIDKRTLELDIHNLLNFISKKRPYTTVILLSNQNEDELAFTNVISLTKKTKSSELICTIKDLSKNIHTKQITDVTKYNLTKTEGKVVRLVGNGLSNKEVAKKLSKSDKTIKTYLTHIFMKLGLQNRYQLIVYTRQLRRKVK